MSIRDDIAKMEKLTDPDLRDLNPGVTNQDNGQADHGFVMTLAYEIKGRRGT